MKHIFRISFVVMVLMLLLPAQAQSGGSVSVNCNNGTSFDKGTEFTVIQMRSGFSYTATVIGIDGFDPILAVLDGSGRVQQCNDDSSDAAGFSVDLPTTGEVNANERSAQVVFSQNTSDMANMSLVVGGFNSEPGEFVLLLEGMASTSFDGTGDPFTVRLSQQMVDSGVPLTTYMIGINDALDPRLFIAGSEPEPFVDDNGEAWECDDGGTASCWGESSDLRGSFVSRTNDRSSSGDSLDAIIQVPMDLFRFMDFNEDDLYLTYFMTNTGGTSGDYVLAFHVSTTGDAAVTQAAPTERPSRGEQRGASNPDLVGGVDVTCDDGGRFTNGVELVVNQMRPGFSYTATAIGIGDFDPILAVLDEDGGGLCNDDSDDALDFFADLPTVGEVRANSRSSQVVFAQTASQMADVSLVVGGYNSEPGEFVLILEGMATTTADGVGDPFSVQITPGLAGSGVPLSAFMIGVPDAVDPLMFVLGDGSDPFVDETGEAVICDDGGNESLCWGTSYSLESSVVSRTNGRIAAGGSTDAMLSIPMSDFAGLDFDGEPLYVTFIMTRFESSGTGDYVIAFHAEAR